MHYGHRVRILHWFTDQIMTDAMAEMDLTAAQGRLLGFVARRPEPPCPRDIEVEFQMSHPTVSGLLSRMEKKGFLETRQDPVDKRCKRIYLLPKGQASIARMDKTIGSIERRIVDGFSPQEQQQFADLLERAIINMGGNPFYSCCKEDASKK